MNDLTVTLHKKEIVWGWCYLLFQLFALPVIIVLLSYRFSRPFTEIELNFVLFSINFIIFRTANPVFCQLHHLQNYINFIKL